MSLVSFDICKGNPGALDFLIRAYDCDMFLLQSEGFPECSMPG